MIDMFVAVLGLRLDDTRIDLLAGEEPASVPSTPLGIVPSGE